MLRHEIHGQGEPIVLLHGYQSSGMYWRSLLPVLAQTHRVIIIDLLGFGRSSKPKDSDYSIETQADAVLATLRHCIPGQRYVLVGHSMGALVASTVAHRDVAHVRKLVLFNMPVLQNYTEATALYRKAHLGGIGVQPLFTLLVHSPVGRIAWPFVNLLPRTPLVRLIPRKFQPIARASTRSSHVSRTRSLEAIARSQGVGLLRQLAIPTVFVGGLQDRVVYKRALDAAKDELPAHLDIIWLDDGHHIPVWQPKTALSYIAQ